MITRRRRTVTVILLGLACVPARDASPQSVSSPDLPWAGWAQCEITIQAPGYSHREAHRWTITGGLTKNGSMEIYPATWSVTGDGSLQRVDGPSAQWRVNGTLRDVQILVQLQTNRYAGDAGRIIVQRWTGHGPARGALTGGETISGTTRSRAIALDVQQWPFPLVEDVTTSTRITGSNVSSFDGARGPMAPAADRPQGSATCSWEFTRGARVSPQTAMPSATLAAPQSQRDPATLSDPARTRAIPGTPSSEPASSSGGTNASTPTMTTAIVPAVLAVPSASTTPSPGPSPAKTNTAPGSAPSPQLDATLLEPPTNVTVSCHAKDEHTKTCTLSWTRATAATGYIVIASSKFCMAAGGLVGCRWWKDGASYVHVVAADSGSSPSMDFLRVGVVTFSVKATYPNGGQSIPVSPQ